MAGRLAYVLPGVVADEEVDLCVQLNAPLLGPSPGVAEVAARKSGAALLGSGSEGGQRGDPRLRIALFSCKLIPSSSILILMPQSQRPSPHF